MNTTEDLWRLTKTILTFVEHDVGECADCDLLRAIATEVLEIKKKAKND